MTWCNKFGIHYLFNDAPISLLSILIPCIILYEHSYLHLLHCMWLRCIRSCTEDLSHGFFANRWLVHNQFMGLSNLLEVVVHYLLIRWMTCLSYRVGFSMVSALVCIVTHWTGPTISHWFVPNWCLSWFVSSWCSLIEGVINKIYNLLHHILG